MIADWVTRWRAAGCPRACGGTERKRRNKVIVAPTRKNRSYAVDATYTVAREYLQVLSARRFAEQGLRRTPKNFMTEFMKKRGLCSDHKARCHFRRVLKKVRRHSAAGKPNPTRLRGRRRFHGRQGCHLIKAPVLRERLFKWFCTVRGAIKGRLPMVVLKAKAATLRTLIIKEALQRGFKARVPVISNSWLFRFRQEYNISLRRPNRRWKVPRKVFLSRLRCMWLNTIRARCLALLLHKYDLEADGFDQKPLHLNEAGSKNQPT